jgi:uncharacterized membrane protein
MQAVRQLIEWVALSIEVLAVAVIVGAIIVAVISGGRWRTDAVRSDIFTDYKRRMGRGLLLGLELLLAADIIGTVALTTPTLQSLASLGLLAVIRSFLSWSLDVELDGCWPWRMRAEGRAGENAAPVGRASNVSTNE